MEKIKIRKIYALIALGAFLCFLPSLGLSQPCTATIVGGSSYSSINAAVGAAVFGNTINVSGTCYEVVQILANKSNITLNGNGTATIIGPSVAAPSMVITGTQIFVNGFNMTGGIAGIQIAQGAVATINGNNIYGTQRNGIVVVMNSFATIINNTIQDTGQNPNYVNTTGIEVSDNASAWIGVSRVTDTVASPNIIRDNQNGIRVRRSASAVIVGNQISNNTDDGIRVLEGSVADLAGNLIDGNGQNGIFVSQGSGVTLADDDTGTAIFNLPNSGMNGEKGLSCSIGGYVDGVLGDLDGLHGAVSISKGCFNSLTKSFHH